MHFDELQNRRVAVWGAGREGLAFLKLFGEHFPGSSLTVLNDTPVPADVQTRIAALAAQHRLVIRYASGQEISQALFASDLLVRSPSVSIYREELVRAQAHGIAITTGSNLWFAKHQHETILAVTGTKGKSTTSSLIAHLLARSGKEVVLAGNIGRPLLESFDRPAPEIWVLELSSYQVSDLQYRPSAALLTSLYPCHLDWHGSLELYLRDKLGLFRGLSPQAVSILNADDEITRLQKLPWHNPLWYNAPDSIHSRAGRIYIGDQFLVDAAEFKLLGKHNLSNLCGALTALRALRLPLEDLLPGIGTFSPLSHRLEDLGVRAGIRYINDSVATVPEAALAAIDSIGNAPLTLLLGGQDKHSDWEAFAVKLLPSPVEHVITIPDCGPQIAAALGRVFKGQERRPFVHSADGLPQALALAQSITPPGGVVLLSPGCPSYGQFRNFEERGDLFKKLLEVAPL